MKLYLLTARGDLPRENPWSKPWDKMEGVLIRAENEERARQLAQKQGGDEIRFGDVWLDSTLTSCEELNEDGSEDILLVDFHAG